jgi:ubiquinone/menaquinone biosynthesis C-methylase UbiE
LNPGSIVNVLAMTTPSPTVTNHHAHHPGFAGPRGLITALSMARPNGRDHLAVERSGVGPQDHVVDVGCGPGAAVRLAAGRGARVTGVEPAPVMLRVARVLSARSRRTTYAQGGAESLPLADGSATIVWTVASVHHWPDVDGGLAEVHRVLQPGGCFLAIENRTAPGATGLASHGWTDEQAERFAAECRTHGFTDVQVERHDAGRRPVHLVAATRP